MKIGELARRTLHTAETIRHYERMGLLPAPRRFANNYRDYGEVHVGRLEFIRHCRTLDISLDEIRSLLESIEDGSPEGADRAHVMIHRHLEAVEARMAELQAAARAALLARGRLLRGATPRASSVACLSAFAS